MLVGGEGVRAGAGQQFLERRVVGQLGADQQGVDEVADQPVEFGALPACDRRTQGDVPGRRVPGEDHAERGRQRHERGRVVLPREAVDRRPQLAVHGERELGAVPGAHGRPGPVRRQFVGARAGQPLPPVLQVVSQPLRRLMGPAPRRVVPVLQGQRRQFGLAVRRQGRIGPGQFGPQHPHRRTVDRDVVDHQYQQRVVLGQPRHGDPEDGSVGQRERLAHQFTGELHARRVPFTGVVPDDVVDQYRDRRGRQHPGTGAPSRSSKTVRSTSCRPATTVKLRASTSVSSAPRTLITVDVL